MTALRCGLCDCPLDECHGHGGLARLFNAMKGWTNRRLDPRWRDIECAEAVVEGLASEECQLPPDGWRCTRGAGHPGPCAGDKQWSDMPRPRLVVK